VTIRFDGRVAIVTGAGAGLGRSHAKLLAARGAKVVVNDPGAALDGTGARVDVARQVVAEIEAAGGTAIASMDSVADKAGAARIVQAAVDAWGRIDVLVNNAGILRDKTFAKMEMADFEAVLQVHLLGSAYCTKAAWPHMQAASYGRVVFTTSNAGLFGNFGQSNYGAAKVGLIGLMNVLKQEGAKNGILVNTLAPIAATRMTETMMTPAMLAKLDPAYVSPALAWLCSEACADTGMIVTAGAGHFAAVRFEETAGLTFARAPTPEDVAAHWAEITDFAQATGFARTMDEAQKVMSTEAKA
jgi:NAD(P)-dependent dehydrogenase (short-subunit alcohol dehydrogenase family)